MSWRLASELTLYVLGGGTITSFSIAVIAYWRIGPEGGN
jgi:hypothetical protein